MRYSLESFLAEHFEVSRRFFLKAGSIGAAALYSQPLSADESEWDARLRQAIEQLEPYFTPQLDFGEVTRAKPYKLPEEEKRKLGLTRDSWSLEVISDPENPVRLDAPLTREQGTALDFQRLMVLAKSRAVRFSKVLTCLNRGRPLGMGLWEGVPMRDIVWLTQPRQTRKPVSLPRRIFFHGYPNDKPEKTFRSSLSASRVFEDPPGLPPVILCYKLNGQWLTSERGGPVRAVVPEAYGFKSIKWLTHLVVSNLFHANDTYANERGMNNDIDSPLKTFAGTLGIPPVAKAGEPIPVTGYAQVGVSGLSKVQYWVHQDSTPEPANENYYAEAPWQDAELLPPPGDWGGGLPGGKIPIRTMNFDSDTRRPHSWPMPLCKAHWAVLLPARTPGQYTFRCRTVDANGNAQPMPRPFQKWGHGLIEERSISVA
jgi:hypothetical protein